MAALSPVSLFYHERGFVVSITRHFCTPFGTVAWLRGKVMADQACRILLDREGFVKDPPLSLLTYLSPPPPLRSASSRPLAPLSPAFLAGLLLLPSTPRLSPPPPSPRSFGEIAPSFALLLLARRATASPDIAALVSFVVDREAGRLAQVRPLPAA